MALTVHVLHGIQTPTSFYSQLLDATPSPQIQALLGLPSGHPQPLFRGARGFKPQVAFRTHQLATLLTEAGIFGKDESAGNTDLWYRKVTNLGSRTAGSVHTRLRMIKAFLYWRSISARQEGECSADCMVRAVYDGTNNPLAAVGSLALSGTSTAAEYFSLGPIAINGTLVTGLQEGVLDATIDLGIELIERGSGSAGWDTFVAVKAINPIVTIRGAAIEPWINYGSVGAALTSFTLYLRKCNNDAAGGIAYVADATAEHIKFTSSAGLVTVEDTTGGENNEAATGLRLYLRAASSAADALTISAASAIA